MKRVFSFGNGVAEGAGLGKERLGGKGAGLAEMTALGIPVPPAGRNCGVIPPLLAT